MRYVLALFTLCMITGCAAKKHSVADTPGVHKYADCKEISRSVTSITVACPLDQEVKK